MTRSVYILAAGWLLAGSIWASADPLADGYRDMYNLRFDSAHKTFQEYQRTNPGDPMGPVSDGAAYLFFEFERLNILRSEFFQNDQGFLSLRRVKPDPIVKQEFEAALERARRLSEALLQHDGQSKEALLANVIRIALRADYEALIEKQNWEALNEIKVARNLADALVKRYPDCYDAYLAAGVENYLLSQKAAPLRMVLRWTGAQTDKQEGLRKLQLVADNGHYLKPYAKILLALAALRDQKKAQAVALLRELAAQFPQNGLFLLELKKLS
jgi:hypothetical protein